MQGGAINSTWGRSVQGSLLIKFLSGSFCVGWNVQKALWILSGENGAWDVSLHLRSPLVVAHLLPLRHRGCPFLTTLHTWILNLLYTEWDMPWICFLYILFLPGCTFEDTFIRNLSLAFIRNMQILLVSSTK